MPLMVGVFFDGTGSSRTDNPDRVSNIGKLSYLYSNDDGSKALYVRGVGSKRNTDDDPIDDDFGSGQIGGGAFGNGGRKRIDYILARLSACVSDGAQELVIDVFGFSRGAALARAFINIILDQTHQHDLLKQIPRLSFRFVGLYDTVGSFTFPGDNNDGYNFHINNDKARYVYQITAQDEIRSAFDLHTLKTSVGDALNAEVTTALPWMIENPVLGVHSDIGGSYPNKTTQGNSRNDLARLYLADMHATAMACEVPFQGLANLPEALDWLITDELQSSFDSLQDIYQQYPQLLPYHQLLKNAQRQLEVIDKRANRSSSARPRRDVGRRRDKRQSKYLRSRIDAAKQLITSDVFAGDIDQSKTFLFKYEQFRNHYIHCSHAPFNSTPDMGAQLIKRDLSSAIEKQLAALAPDQSYVIKGFFQRDVFYNTDDRNTSQVKARRELLCHLKFVQKSKPSEHFPAGVTIEVWDDDLFRDDKLGVGVTDVNGCVEILCFDVDLDKDIYFAFSDVGASFQPGGDSIPANWDSHEHKSFAGAMVGDLVLGRLDDYLAESLGLIDAPFVVYV